MRRTRKHIIIQISNRGVFYNPTDHVDWAQTNFPDKCHFHFNERETIFWKVAMVGYDKDRAILHVEVADFGAGALQDSFARQNPKYPIKGIWFGKISWPELKKQMNIYRPQDFVGLADFSTPDKTPTDSQPQEPALIGYRYGGNFGKEKTSSSGEKIELHFSYPLMKTTFKMGYVEIEKKVKGVQDKVQITLKNDCIIPEFDHVKPYFSKVLGKRKIEVRGHIEFDEKGKIKTRCRSEEINRIDEDLIAGVKKLSLKNSIMSPSPAVVDKSLFTPEEYFDGMEDELLGNTYRKSDKELLGDILELSDIRNKKQLLYLSGKLQSKKTRLRFTLSPKFGFLFTVEGEEMDHFLWELLDSHATYIWSMPKDTLSLEEKYKRLEREINFIRDNGRKMYLNNLQVSDFAFHKVNHEKQNSLVDGFPKWRMRVNELIV